MPTLLTKIRALLKQPSVAVLATVTEEGRPWARYVMAMGDEKRIRFSTFTKSRKVAQVKKNPEVHITCGIRSLENMSEYLQVQGRAKVVTDRKTLAAYWNPALAGYYTGPDDPNYCLMDVIPYRIEYMGPSMKAEVWEAKAAAPKPRAAKPAIVRKAAAKAKPAKRK